MADGFWVTCDGLDAAGGAFRDVGDQELEFQAGSAGFGAALVAACGTDPSGQAFHGAVAPRVAELSASMASAGNEFQATGAGLREMAARYRSVDASLRGGSLAV